MPLFVANAGVPGRRAFGLTCAAAGALAVPLHPVATVAAAGAAAMAGLFGLWVWRCSGLPVSQPLAPPARLQRLPHFLRDAGPFALGLTFGLCVLAFLRLVLQPAFPELGTRLAAAASQPLWRRAAAVFVAAVGEELAFRVILLSAIAGLLVRLLPPHGRGPAGSAAGAANALSALIYAAAHLPAWRGAAPPGSDAALAVLCLDALGGILFGGVLVRRGITAAMWAHAGADCAMLLIGPLT